VSDDAQSKTTSSKKDFEMELDDYWMSIDSKDVSILKDFRKTGIDVELKGEKDTKQIQRKNLVGDDSMDIEEGERNLGNEESIRNQKQISISTSNPDHEKLVVGNLKKQLLKIKNKQTVKYLKIQGNSGREAIMNICGKCLIVNFENNKHCFDCRKCVKFLDHHNKILNVCIGRDNLHFFVQFLILNWGYILSLLIIMVHYLLQWILISEFILINKDNDFQPGNSQDSSLNLNNSASIFDTNFSEIKASNQMVKKHLSNVISSTNYFNLNPELNLKNKENFNTFKTVVTKNFLNSLFFSKNNVDDNSNLVCILTIFLVAILCLYFFYLSYLVILYVQLLGKNIPRSEYPQKIWISKPFSFKVFFQKLFGKFNYHTN
jgi:hypothetical protein